MDHSAGTEIDFLGQCGAAAVMLGPGLEKLAGIGDLEGTLTFSRTGWLVLNVPNAIGNGAFQCLSETGIEQPKSESLNRYNAHISVMSPDEVSHAGGPEAIRERGKQFGFNLGRVKMINNPSLRGVSKCWVLQVTAPELNKLRRSYGLTSEPKYPYHITFAVKKTQARESIVMRYKRARLRDAVNTNQLFKEAASIVSRIGAARRRTNTNPTEGQISAGTYAKGKVNMHGLRISLENPKGSTRSGTSPTGKKWTSKMYSDYGYIGGTLGKDGDHVDVFIGDDPETELVFVVNQVDPKTREFDEHKCMLGFRTRQDAKAGYLANYEKGWKGIGSIVGMTMAQFKRWLKDGSQKKPAEES